jgi:hypothetical protein
VDENQLFVKNNQLMIGDSLASAEPYRASDYVLYSFMGPEENRRDDLDSLPFSETWDGVREEATSPIDDPNYKNARIQMGALYQQLISSPDLTDDQAMDLAEKWFKQMETIHGKAKKFGMLAGKARGSAEDLEANARQDKVRKRALEIAKGL